MQSTNKKKPEPANIYLLLNSSSIPIAKGHLENAPNEKNMQMRVVEGSVDELVEAQYIQVVSMDNNVAARLGSVILRRGNLIILEPLRPLSNEVRRNLRMPVNFTTRIFPLIDGVKRSIPVRGNDLSCGGISFFTDLDFEPGDQMEVIIPITRFNPMVLTCQILRKRDEAQDVNLYSAKFIEVLNEQEMLVREAIFSLQLKRDA